MRKPCLDASFVADLFKRNISSDIHDLLTQILCEGSLHFVDQLVELRLWHARRKCQLLECLSLLLKLLEKADFLDEEAALGVIGVAIGVGPVMSVAAGVDIHFRLALRGRPHI